MGLLQVAYISWTVFIIDADSDGRLREAVGLSVDGFAL